MKKLKKALAGILCLSMLGQACPVFAAETPEKAPSILDDGNFDAGEHRFVFELLDTIVEYWINHASELDVRSVNEKLDYNDPANSKIEALVGNEETKKVIEDIVESMGYDKSVLMITVTSAPIYDDTIVDPIDYVDEELKFVFKVLKVVEEYCYEHDELDVRNKYEELNFEEPENSKVAVVVGDEETGKVLADYVESQGYDRNVLKITIARPSNRNEEFSPKEFRYIFDIVDSIVEYWRENSDDIKIRTVADKLNYDEPENSKIEITAIDEATKEAVCEYVESLGYDRSILEIRINPDYAVPKIDGVFFIGDINMDNSIDMLDLTELSLYLLGNREFSIDEEIFADVNSDDEVNMADLAHFKQFLLGADVMLG